MNPLKYVRPNILALSPYSTARDELREVTSASLSMPTSHRFTQVSTAIPTLAITS